MNNHYEQKYYNWQKSIGQITAEANRFLYQEHIDPTSAVLDFGCGGGFLLARLKCGKKYGVEINEHAAEEARNNGISVYANLTEVRKKVEVVISSHALEHTHDPLGILKQMIGVLKPGGKIVIVTPFERHMPWSRGDINQHLFTWSPMNLGNLAELAGFKVISSDLIYHRFPPKSRVLMRVFGAKLYHHLCCIWGRVYGKVRQVRLIAEVARDNT